MRDVGATGPAAPVFSASGAKREPEVVVLLPTTAPPYTTPEEIEQYRKLERIVDEMNAVRQSLGGMATPASPVLSGVSGATGPGQPLPPVPSSGPNEVFDIDIIGADGAMGPQFGGILVDEQHAPEASPSALRCGRCNSDMPCDDARCLNCTRGTAKVAHDVGYQTAMDELVSRQKPS